jgi:hypothetical protein
VEGHSPRTGAPQRTPVRGTHRNPLRSPTFPDPGRPHPHPKLGDAHLPSDVCQKADHRSVLVLSCPSQVLACSQERSKAQRIPEVLGTDLGLRLCCLPEVLGTDLSPRLSCLPALSSPHQTEPTSEYDW